MNRFAALLVLALVAPLAALSQTSEPAQSAAPQADSPTLAAILTELRSIHNDVRLGQTTQILLTELEVQENAVNRATQRRDDLRNRLSQVQSNEKNLTSQLAHIQDNASDTVDPIQIKQLKNIQDQLKSSAAGLAQQEKDISNDLIDAESGLRKEQDTLQGIQDRLDAVVRKLQPATIP